MSSSRIGSSNGRNTTIRRGDLNNSGTASALYSARQSLPQPYSHSQSQQHQYQDPPTQRMSSSKVASNGIHGNTISSSNSNNNNNHNSNSYFLSVRSIPYCTRAKHQSEKIIRVCVQPNCEESERLLCGHCIIYHATHPAKLIPVQEFVERCSVRHREVNVNHLNEHSVEQDLVQEIESRFEKIREDFYAFLIQKQVELINYYRNILGFSRDFNLSYLQELEGKSINDLTKPEWDLIVNLYWKDDIDHALAVKDQVIRQVAENMKANFDVIQLVSEQNSRRIGEEIAEMMKMAEDEVRTKNAPVNMNNLDQWNKNYEKKMLLSGKLQNIGRLEEELARANRNLKEAKESMETIQMDVLTHDNRVKEIKEKEAYLKYELEKVINPTGTSASLRDDVEQARQNLNSTQNQVDLITAHTLEYNAEMTRKMEALKKKKNETKQAIATDFTQAGEAEKMAQLEQIDEEIVKLQQAHARTKKSLDSERGSLLIQREDQIRELERKQQSKEAQILAFKQEKQKLHEERVKLDLALDQLRKKQMQKETQLRDSKGEVKKKEWMLLQEKAESEQIAFELRQMEQPSQHSHNGSTEYYDTEEHHHLHDSP